MAVQQLRHEAEREGADVQRRGETHRHVEAKLEEVREECPSGGMACTLPHASRAAVCFAPWHHDSGAGDWVEGLNWGCN